MPEHRPVPVRIAVTALAAGLLLAGCSSSGGGGKTVDLSTVPVVAADLPSGWTAKTHDASGDADDAATNKKLDACLGARNTSGDQVDKVYSKDFSMGDSEVSSSAALFKSDSDVSSDVKTFSNPKAKSCYESLFRQQAATGFPNGATISKLDIELTPGNNGGPDNVVATAKATIGVLAQGKSVTVYTTGVYITGNKIEAEIDFTGVGAQVDAATMSKVIDAVAKRAAG